MRQLGAGAADDRRGPGAAAADLLTPVYEDLKANVLASAVLHTDDTPAPVLDRTRTETRPGRLRGYVGDGRPADIVYDYTADRSRAEPLASLESFRGDLQAHAHAGYDALYATGRVVGLGEQADRVLPTRPIGEAVGYARAQWTALTSDCEDGALAIDNHAAERAPHGVCTGRPGSSAAATRAARAPRYRPGHCARPRGGVQRTVTHPDAVQGLPLRRVAAGPAVSCVPGRPGSGSITHPARPYGLSARIATTPTSVRMSTGFAMWY